MDRHRLVFALAVIHLAGETRRRKNGEENFFSLFEIRYREKPGLRSTVISRVVK